MRAMAGSMVYRLPVGDARAPYMQAFSAAMAAAERRLDRAGYNAIAGFHGAPDWYCWHHQQNPRTTEQARLFLPWHRAYLWWLEQALQDRARDLPPAIGATDISLPWWDWTAVRDVPTAYRSTSTSTRDRNPLAATRAYVPTARPPVDRWTRRAPGANPFSRLPTRAQVDSLLEDSDFASFSDRLEDFHDSVHGWVGGDMGSVSTAAYDPIFFAHHCMIDRLWYLWQVRWGIARIPPSLIDLPLSPFGLTVRDTLSVQRLGYEYANRSLALPPARPRRGSRR
jgi:tyrosinase